MTSRYTVMEEGYLPVTGVLLETHYDAIISRKIASGSPGEMKALARRLNAAEESLAKLAALTPEAASTPTEGKAA
ncbi:hypothetical protein SEA_CREWMATE_62 [Arthrobacter phage Crewmate]|uniref:Uncharacterized protein n=1 Tax=Arthrobacter phage Crewmate TaxID=2832317 RepID=A0AA48Y3M7_9CAUD|nr:hypothetical protein PQE17_gp62 [Arthrobacter phage Crewmate]UIW13313.1 hypothetical protein SEA_CREWMATE_62 [Arthrobacter phage Crewmate]